MRQHLCNRNELIIYSTIALFSLLLEGMRNALMVPHLQHWQLRYFIYPCTRHRRCLGCPCSPSSLLQPPSGAHSPVSVSTQPLPCLPRLWVHRLVLQVAVLLLPSFIQPSQELLSGFCLKGASPATPHGCKQSLLIPGYFLSYPLLA